ncbi:hypothetical protein [Actibacterium sp. MT2.3-13A]|uniref:hypothetical protein n=1 Tax=Actibacterium sp. MT2.3-13A TaxID=2828332 RepID=UPI001BAAFDD9|nr:hypothetical protein [Actibacterium sp. MT2.3-13A]
MTPNDAGQGTVRIAAHDEKYPPHTMPSAPKTAKCPSATLPVDAIVLTLRGALPVQDLRRGDRVITQSGGCPLRRVHVYDGRHYTLEFDSHEKVFVLDSQYWPHSETKAADAKSTH